MTRRAPAFNAVKNGQTARIEIYDDLGPSWFGMIDTRMVAQKLRDLGDVSEIEVRINSLGGDANQGLGIYNLLRDHPAKVTTVVDGIAASAASIVLMAGDTRRVPDNALVMIHNAWTIAIGGEDELLKAAEVLATYNRAIAATYAASTGKPAEEMAALMAEETWMTGAEAKERGFATETAAPLAVPKSEPAAKAAAESLFRRAPGNWTALIALTPRPTDDPMPAPNPTPAPQNTPAPNPTPAPQATPQPSPAVPPAPTPTPVDAAAERAAAKAAEKERTTQILALCKTSGFPAEAEAFIAGDQSVADVRDALFQRVCQNRAPVSEPGNGDPAPTDPKAKFEREYDAHADRFAALNLTKEQYVASRLKDAK